MSSFGTAVRPADARAGDVISRSVLRAALPSPSAQTDGAATPCSDRSASDGWDSDCDQLPTDNPGSSDQLPSRNEAAPSATGTDRPAVWQYTPEGRPPLPTSEWVQAADAAVLRCVASFGFRSKSNRATLRVALILRARCSYLDGCVDDACAEVRVHLCRSVRTRTRTRNRRRRLASVDAVPTQQTAAVCSVPVRTQLASLGETAWPLPVSVEDTEALPAYTPGADESVPIFLGVLRPPRQSPEALLWPLGPHSHADAAELRPSRGAPVEPAPAAPRPFPRDGSAADGMGERSHSPEVPAAFLLVGSKAAGTKRPQRPPSRAAESDDAAAHLVRSCITPAVSGDGAESDLGSMAVSQWASRHGSDMALSSAGHRQRRGDSRSSSRGSKLPTATRGATPVPRAGAKDVHAARLHRLQVSACDSEAALLLLAAKR